jgi:redox-sensitive bicupin YhaK (pirin superfamily)
MMVYFKQDAETLIEVPSSFNAMVYVLDGTIESNGATLEKFNISVSDHDGDAIQLKAKSDGKLLFLAGEPINEPVVSYVPFVMNYPGEIKQAMMDYEMGKMGVLET